MAVLDLYEDENIAAAMAAPVVAPRKQEPAFSLWGAVRGLGKAVPAGVAEQAGSTADILNAYGSVTAATGINAGGMFSTGTDDQKKQRDDAAKKLREQGPDYRSEAGALFRGVAKDYMPDPLTTHGAEQAVAEFGRVATKAITSAVTLGPLAGAALAGAEEGFTASDKLAEQGVDLGTRTKVGAVTGAVTGLGFALPVAGKTIAQTVGLAVAGGPASFMAQNAATREILQRADYTKLADQYDPFDPVGLTLSTLIPLGFGAVAMRAGARRAAPSSRPQENEALAPEQQAPEAAPIAPEVVDAARVDLLRETLEASRVTPPEDFAGAAAHETAVAQAIDQLATGQRVEVAQLLEITPEQREANFKAWFGDSKVVGEDGAPLVVYRGGASTDWETGKDITEFRSKNGPWSGFFTDDPRVAEKFVYGSGIVSPAYLRVENPLIVDAAGRPARDFQIDASAIGKQDSTLRQQFLDGDYDALIVKNTSDEGTIFVPKNPEQVKSAIGNSGRFDPNSPSLTDPVVQIAQRMAASLEPVRAEIDALLAQVEQQDAAPLMRATDEMAQPETVATQAPDATSPPPAPDLATIARQAVDTLTSAESPAEALARVPGVIADAVDSMQGQQVDAAPQGGGQVAPPLAPQPAASRASTAPASPIEARLNEAAARNPGALDTLMPTEFDADGKTTDAVSAREYLDTVKAEADQEAADADLLQVAANCFLNMGG